jgi:predicted dehydrogenase
MSKIRLGVLGGGGDSLIGVLHRVASNMYDRYEITGGVFNPDYKENIKFAEQIGVNTDRVYVDFETFIAEEIKKPKEERIEVVSVLTPNFLHFPMAKKLLENGFHVICEKPLTTTYAEAKELEALQKTNNAIFAVTYTYTGYPMVRHMKHMIAEGELGEIQKIDVQYYQGWINPVIHDPEVRKTVWRLDPKKAGISSCIGDIGTHAFQMTEYLTGMEVKSILA